MIRLKINNVDVALNQVSFSDGAKSLSLRGALPTYCNNATIEATPDGSLPELFFEIAQCVDVLRQKNNRIEIKLIMPYIPYARQDRPMVRNDSFSLRVFADLLNSLNLDKVIVVDAHSNVSTALIRNCVHIEQHQLISYSPILVIFPKDCVLVAPDEGSLKKINKVADVVKPAGVVVMSKERDVSTGQIIGSSIVSSPFQSLEGRTCTIVDDICDGGATFISIAQKLKEAGVERVYLWVTHGIFSKGLTPLLEQGIDGVYTTNSLNQSKQLDKDWRGKFCSFNLSPMISARSLM